MNIVVPDDLDAIAPWIPEIKEIAIYWSYAGSVEGAPGCLLVIDDETEVAARTLAASLRARGDSRCGRP